MDQYKATILQTDTPLASGNIYPRDVVEKAIAKLDKDRPLLLLADMPTTESGLTINLERIIGTISDVHLDVDGYVVGIVEQLATPLGHLCAREFVESNGTGMGIAGYCNRSLTGEVSDLAITSVSVINSPTFSPKFFDVDD